jgi:hypothetical protein
MGVQLLVKDSNNNGDGDGGSNCYGGGSGGGQGNSQCKQLKQKQRNQQSKSKKMVSKRMAEVWRWPLVVDGNRVRALRLWWLRWGPRQWQLVMADRGQWHC